MSFPGHLKIDADILVNYKKNQYCLLWDVLKEHVCFRKIILSILGCIEIGIYVYPKKLNLLWSLLWCHEIGYFVLWINRIKSGGLKRSIFIFWSIFNSMEMIFFFWNSWNGHICLLKVTYLELVISRTSWNGHSCFDQWSIKKMILSFFQVSWNGQTFF